MAVVRRIPCTVATVTDHGERVYSVDLVPSLPVPRFKPGQFLHLALDPSDPGGFWPESRVFSIASSPAERERLTITYAVKGAFTSRMERELLPGVGVCVKLPYGDFVVDPARDAVLFAGGTGVTAFTAFLGSLEAGRGPNVLLFYGARTPDLFVYGELVRERASAVPSLSVHLVSEETDGRLATEAAWPAAEAFRDPFFYLSGPPQMLTALTQQLRDRGVTTEAIRTDAWE